MKQLKTVTLDRNQNSPELTPAMEKAFRLAAKKRNAKKGVSFNLQ